MTFDDGFGLEIDAKEFVAISNALEVEIYHIDEKIQGVTDDDITDESIDGVNGDDIVVE
ncbi:hypothetical protein [Herbiconiux daphne]|uniref:Uncharacterized protein n=1 Tax=Herbiconiux daphne TaxID=2970914 RepID=A0ABT2H9B5_9MICO|nr:hypothetical protein [Herbiconiux daphne]MCS5736534.1 hypothetical protein [Herbiconiux daphne]